MDLARHVAGAGQPMLLIHGHPFDRTMWAPQVDHFATRGWRVIAPDLRGYGRSGVVAGKTTLATFARDLATLLDELGAAEAVVVGLSMGGQVAMEFYRLFPGRVRALVLADTSPRAETAAGRRARNDLADRLLREGMGRYAEEVLPKMVAPTTVTAAPHVADHVLAMMRRTPPAGAAAALRGRAERPDYVDVLRGATLPTLVVVGGLDAFTPVEEARFLQALVAGSTLAVIPDAGHLPNLEQPEAFNAVVERFLTDLVSVTGS